MVPVLFEYQVWTRFPVNAAIVKETIATAIHQPRSILFVSNASSSAFAPYFDTMVWRFEYKTRKPTKNLLKQIIIRASQEWEHASSEIPTSEFQTGDWLVGLFCLIPLHLAVTRSNRFIPLRDGVDSPEFEHSLLGANVAQISEAYVKGLPIFIKLTFFFFSRLSFGWYESIFSSYLANKASHLYTETFHAHFHPE